MNSAVDDACVVSDVDDLFLDTSQTFMSPFRFPLPSPSGTTPAIRSQRERHALRGFSSEYAMMPSEMRRANRARRSSLVEQSTTADGQTGALKGTQSESLLPTSKRRERRRSSQASTHRALERADMGVDLEEMRKPSGKSWSSFDSFLTSSAPGSREGSVVGSPAKMQRKPTHPRLLQIIREQT